MMRQKTQMEIPLPDRQQALHPVFADFLKPNPFVYPWMVPFLPKERRTQDFAVVGIGCVLFFLIFLLLYEVGFGEIISVGIGLTGIAILTGENEARWMIAGARYGRAKRKTPDQTE